jgi:hypothetical protein
VEIEVSVESIDFTQNVAGEDEAQLYMRTMFDFYHLVMSNQFGSLSRAEQGLQENYGCSRVSIRCQATSLTLSANLPRKRLVGVQCDQSSGQLAKDVGKWLLSPLIKDHLKVLDLQLSTEVTN